MPELIPITFIVLLAAVSVAFVTKYRRIQTEMEPRPERLTASDADLAGASYQKLLNEVLLWRRLVRADRDSDRHDLCWWRPELWSALPEGYSIHKNVPPWPEFMARCAEFRATLDKPYDSCGQGKAIS